MSEDGRYLSRLVVCVGIGRVKDPLVWQMSCTPNGLGVACEKKAVNRCSMCARTSERGLLETALGSTLRRRRRLAFHVLQVPARRLVSEGVHQRLACHQYVSVSTLTWG